jgi:translation initiation factor 2 subunit 2
MSIESLYQYEDLLDGLYEQMETPEMKREINVLAPEVRVLGKKTNFVNFEKMCLCLDRECCHLKHFLETELMTTSSVNLEGVLIINGKYRTGGIQNVLLKYISSYVQCPSCHSIKTALNRENRLRLIKCSNCHSTKYVGAT